MLLQTDEVESPIHRDVNQALQKFTKERKNKKHTLM